jgi:plasmid stability protein
MATLHITGISDETLARLASRAAAKQQSIEAYLRNLIEREAAVLAVEIAAEQRRRR